MPECWEAGPVQSLESPDVTGLCKTNELQPRRYGGDHSSLGSFCSHALFPPTHHLGWGGEAGIEWIHRLRGSGWMGSFPKEMNHESAHCQRSRGKSVSESSASFLDRCISLHVRRRQDVERLVVSQVMTQRSFDELYLGLHLRDPATLNLQISRNLHQGCISVQQPPTQRNNNFPSKYSSTLATQCKE